MKKKTVKKSTMLNFKGFVILVTPEKLKNPPKTGTLEAISGYNFNQ